MSPAKSISTQMTLLGIPSVPSRADVRALVRHRLYGFELRQQWRNEKRRKRLAKRREMDRLERAYADRS